MFYVGHLDKSSLYETLFHCNTLSKHHHQAAAIQGSIEKTLKPRFLGSFLNLHFFR
jgi:hypothetical protein